MNIIIMTYLICYSYIQKRNIRIYIIVYVMIYFWFCFELNYSLIINWWHTEAKVVTAYYGKFLWYNKDIIAYISSDLVLASL